MPKDPKELLLLAAKSNNLAATDMRPWHLKASCTVLDQQGAVSQQGTLEEFWASPIKTKRIYSGSSFSQTEYVTEKGRFRSGEQTAPSWLLTALVGEFSTPVLVNEKDIDQWVVQREERKDGGAKLICATVTGFQTPTGTHSIPASAVTSYCMEPDRPALLLRESGSPFTAQFVQFSRSNISSFQGRFVPGDIEADQGGKNILKAHVDLLEQLDTISEADLTPPPDAKLIPMRVNISAGVAQGMILQKTVPQYPANALAARISGTVVLQALIGKDGHIADLHVISGPQELQQAALDAVRTWVYKPYLLNGVPVEVNTTVNVIFSLSR